MVVSNPRVGASTVGAIGVRLSRESSNASTVSYVSVEPATYPDATGVSIANITTASAAKQVQIVEGGFDPVAIDARAGDELQLTFTLVSGATNIVTIKVPARRPPAVVRSNPPKGRVDVALNSVSISVDVVFSEPIDPRTINGTSLRVLRNGQPLSGTVRLADNGWTAEFHPDEPLEPMTDYELVVSPDVRDLDGDALGTGYDSKFTTGSIPCERVPLIVADSLTDLVTGCYVSVTRSFPNFWLAMEQTGSKVAAVWGVVDDPDLGDANSRWSPDGEFIAGSSSTTFGAVRLALPECPNCGILIIEVDVTKSDGSELSGRYFWRDGPIPGGATEPAPLLLRRIRTN
jgi:hypothetical protein